MYALGFNCGVTNEKCLCHSRRVGEQPLIFHSSSVIYFIVCRKCSCHCHRNIIAVSSCVHAYSLLCIFFVLPVFFFSDKYILNWFDWNIYFRILILAASAKDKISRPFECHINIYCLSNYNRNSANEKRVRKWLKQQKNANKQTKRGDILECVANTYTHAHNKWVVNGHRTMLSMKYSEKERQKTKIHKICSNDCDF